MSVVVSLDPGHFFEGYPFKSHPFVNEALGGFEILEVIPWKNRLAALNLHVIFHDPLSSWGSSW
jgi:hypothetical protein